MVLSAVTSIPTWTSSLFVLPLLSRRRGGQLVSLVFFGQRKNPARVAPVGVENDKKTQENRVVRTQRSEGADSSQETKALSPCSSMAISYSSPRWEIFITWQ